MSDATRTAAAGLPGQAWYNAHFDSLSTAWTLLRRALALAFAAFAVVKYRAPLGQYALIQQELDESVPLDERAKIARGLAVLAACLAAMMWLQTLPTPGERHMPRWAGELPPAVCQPPPMPGRRAGRSRSSAAATNTFASPQRPPAAHSRPRRRPRRRLRRPVERTLRASATAEL